MFKLSAKFEIDRRILKCDYITYSPPEISSINTPNSQIYLNIPSEDSGNSLVNSGFELNFDVLQAATGNRYADGADIRLVNPSVIALFCIYKLTSSSGKLLEEVNHAHIVCLMYKILSSSKEFDDLSIGFDRSRDRRKRELTNIKNFKGKYHLRVWFRVIFGFAKHQETATYGPAYKFTLTRNTDNAVLNKANATNNAKIKINSLEVCVPHYTLSLNEYNIIMNQIKNKTPTSIHYPERSVFFERRYYSKLLDFRIGHSRRF